MEINDWTSARHLPELYHELKQLDLLEHIAELEAFGFTKIARKAPSFMEGMDSAACLSFSC